MIIALRFGSIPYVFLMYSVRARQFDSEPTLRGAREKFRKFFSGAQGVVIDCYNYSQK